MSFIGLKTGYSASQIKNAGASRLCKKVELLKGSGGTFLVGQWLRICLATQGTFVHSLVGELRSHAPWSS